MLRIRSRSKTHSKDIGVRKTFAEQAKLGKKMKSDAVPLLLLLVDWVSAVVPAAMVLTAPLHCRGRAGSRSTRRVDSQQTVFIAPQPPPL